MKIKLACPECAAASGGFGTFFVETIRDDGLYTGKCPQAHDLPIATQTLRHEMLFEIALNAIIDGYHREAVSSFAASVERFFEFAIRVMASRQKVAAGVYADAWKELAKQSERQLGAYILLCVATFGEMPLLISKRMVDLRNNVIHKGVLPEKKDALKFGNAAYDVIQGGIQKLRSVCLDDLNKVLTEHVEEIAEKMGNRYPRSFQVTQTALNVIEDNSNGDRSFQALLIDRGIQR